MVRSYRRVLARQSKPSITPCLSSTPSVGHIRLPKMVYFVFMSGFWNVFHAAVLDFKHANMDRSA